MSRTINTNIKTIQKSISVGATSLNTEGLYYCKTSNRVLAIGTNKLTKYISSAKAGGDQEMFYAAEGYKKFFDSYNRFPNIEESKNIMIGATSKSLQNVSLFKRNIVDKQNKQNKAEVIPNHRTSDVTQTKLHELDLDITKEHITYSMLPNGTHQIQIRIPVGTKYIRTTINSRDFDNERQMFMAAHEIRQYIFDNGVKPNAIIKKAIIKSANTLKDNQIPSREVKVKNKKVIPTSRMTINHKKGQVPSVKEWASRGRKPNETLVKIKALNLNIKPDFLSFNKNGRNHRVIIRMITDYGFQSSSVSAASVNYNEAAMFIAASEIRNYMMSTGKSPSKEIKAQIINSTYQEYIKSTIKKKVKKSKIRLEKDQLDLPVVIARKTHIQKYKSKTKPGFLGRAKRWLFS